MSNCSGFCSSPRACGSTLAAGSISSSSLGGREPSSCRLGEQGGNARGAAILGTAGALRYPAPDLRRKNSHLLSELGHGGLSSLALALASATLGLGLPVGLRLREVLRRAAVDERRAVDAILVLGRELGPGDEPTSVFRARLEHGAGLWREGWAPEIVVSGGLTGAARTTEAEAGCVCLMALGVPRQAIWTEDRSRFTLENLVNVRAAMRARGLSRLLMVSDPLHLARAAAFARGLALDVACSPATAAPPRARSASWWARATREAFLLHWYHVGVAYSRAIGSEWMLARVT